MNANAFEALLSAYIDSNQILGRKREYLWYTCGLHLIHICARYKLAKKHAMVNLTRRKNSPFHVILAGTKKYSLKLVLTPIFSIEALKFYDNSYNIVFQVIRVVCEKTISTCWVK